METSHTSLPTPTTGRVYVNLLEGISNNWYHRSTKYWVLGYCSINYSQQYWYQLWYCSNIYQSGVGGLEHDLFDFPYNWEFHHPNWGTHIFQRGRAQPPTSMIPTIVGGSDPTMPIYLAPNNAKPRLKLLLCGHAEVVQCWKFDRTHLTLDLTVKTIVCSRFSFKKSSIQVSDPHNATFSQNCVPALSMVCFNIKSSCP